MSEPVNPAEAASLAIDVGTTLGSYKLVALLGEGAMGRVFRARHAKLGREVALKVLNADLAARPDIVQRFFREARVVNEIDHENIVEVTDLVERPGLAYLVMELLEGESLRELLDRRGRAYPKVERLVGILRQVCAALEAAHAKGVVHRDLKPDNVFVIQRDGGDFVKVLDFGVAKLRGAGDLAATTTGMIIGTPHYMSPEQALGRDVTKSTDVWAAGVVLHQALAGAVPFSGASFVELANRIRMQPPAPLPPKTPRGERIPPWLGEVIAKCLEKKPGDRFRSMSDLADALAAGGPSKGRHFQRRLVAAAVALAAAGVLAGVAVKLDLPGRARATWTKARQGWQTVVAEGARAGAEPKPVPPAQAAPKAVPTPAAAAAAPKAPPAARPPPAQPATVELSIRTTPAGARVTRLDTGERLGRTPVRVDVKRKAATVWIQVALDGYQPVKFAVDLRKDNAANVTFQGVKKPLRRR